MTATHPSGRRLLVSYFADEDGLLSAIRLSRQRNYTILEAYTPYAIHGLDEAMGRRRSRLTWVCFGFGLLGLATAIVFQIWASAVDWPLNIGGKPFNSLPAFIPVAFELTVLFAALGTVLALLVRTRLWPGKRPAVSLPRVTNDRFALVLVEADGAFDVGDAGRAMQECCAVAVEERVEGTPR